jgi:CubicO group peptidase (beta-lactamase class C family)
MAIMKNIAVLLLLALSVLCTEETMAQPLPRSTPEEQGISSTAILDFVKTVEGEIDALHSFMLLRHGKVVAEGWWYPYAAERRHRLYSLSTSFVSTAIGIAVADGELTLDDRVLDYFPDEAPTAPDRNLEAMRIRDLLMMSSGHQDDTLGKFFAGGDVSWVRTFLNLPVEHKPGTHFAYNTGATYMLAAILQKTTGDHVVDYLEPRLFEPLGINGYHWQESPQGITVGGRGLRVKTEDIARFGQLYLQKGVWDGERVLSEAWVEAATSRQTSNGSDPDSDWEQGYGYLFWRGRHGSYRTDGAFGQFCIVLPEQDAVLAITGGVRNSKAQDVLDLVWDHLLPAMKPEALPAADQSYAVLTDKISFLFLKPLRAASYSTRGPELSDQIFEFDDNEQGVESMSFDFGRNSNAFIIHDDQGEHRIEVGHGTWLKGESSYDNHGLEPIATSGGWTDADTFMARVFFLEMPYSAKLEFDFSEGRVRFDFGYNVSFGQIRRPQLISDFP